jgi:nucleotide-binding universal stress UspA family protein
MTTHTRPDAGASTTTASVSAYRRLLVATAGEPESRGALSIAAALTERDDAQVMALGVAVPFPHDLSGILSMKPPAEIDDEARQRVADRLRRGLHGIAAAERWTKQALVGLPAETIADSAAAWRASLILLGIGRHRRVDRVFGQETAIAVIRRACAPVLAAPPGARGLPQHALVAVDFTPASIGAAEGAAALVAAGGVVTVAHVCAFDGVKSQPGDLVDLYRSGARAKLDQAVEQLQRRTEHRVESAMLDGEPAQALLAFAHRQHCDLISLGGHEQGLMDRILLGSVRTRVLRGARCSVLIAPPGSPA